MAYIDVYPNCNGCPAYKYCEKVVAGTRICNSYSANESEKENKNSNNKTNERIN